MFNSAVVYDEIEIRKNIFFRGFALTSNVLKVEDGWQSDSDWYPICRQLVSKAVEQQQPTSQLYSHWAYYFYGCPSDGFMARIACVCVCVCARLLVVRGSERKRERMQHVFVHTAAHTTVSNWISQSARMCAIASLGCVSVHDDFECVCASWRDGLLAYWLALGHHKRPNIAGRLCICAEPIYVYKKRKQSRDHVHCCCLYVLHTQSTIYKIECTRIYTRMYAGMAHWVFSVWIDWRASTLCASICIV